MVVVIYIPNTKKLKLTFLYAVLSNCLIIVFKYLILIILSPKSLKKKKMLQMIRTIVGNVRSHNRNSVLYRLALDCIIDRNEQHAML